MTDDRLGDTLRDLLGETADEIVPGDRLDAIRAATSDSGRHTSWGWWAAGSAGLLAASVVTALALTTAGPPDSGEPDPAGPQPTSAIEDPSSPRVVAVYFTGNTPDGSRLYREFQPSDATESAETFALDAALHGDSIDPDYQSRWPEGSSVGAVVMAPDLITVTLEGDLHDRPSGLSRDDARLAVEQVVRTAQGLYGRGRVPVRLLLDDGPTDEVLGVPASEPLVVGSDLTVLARVSLSDPTEGQVLDRDQPFVVRGVANAFDGTVRTRLQRWRGTDVVDEEAVRAQASTDRLVPFEVTFDLTDVAPGDYAVVSQALDPSGWFVTDTRMITVVD